MKFSYNWLKELSGTKKSPTQLSELLLTRAFEVESVEPFVHHLENVVVGKVKKLIPHPNADRLRVAEVEVVRGDVRTIVCGAPNVAVGQKVAVALPGAVLPGNFAIKETEIRGVRSCGMICSEKELGLGESHEGILVLSDDAKVGRVFAEYCGLDDTILDIKILPDRGADTLGYRGLSREIAALEGGEPAFVAAKIVKPRIPSVSRAPRVKIAPDAPCSRYCGVSFKNVTVGASPLWLQSKLIVSGLRPINAVVDITNYLLLAYGQPTHSFDAKKLSGAITVRLAKRNEKLALLNGETVILSPDDMVIADERKVLALAGVMGGAASAVTSETKDVLFEIARFAPALIRRSRVRHNLFTDAATRFERDVDPNVASEVWVEAVNLFSELLGAKLSGLRDVYPDPRRSWKIRLSMERVEKMLGTRVPLFSAVQYLAAQGLTVKKIKGRDELEVVVPTRRSDLRDEWDLVEEIGRMHGYETIEAKAPVLPLGSRAANRSKHIERMLKRTLVASGWDEILTYSFYSENDARQFGDKMFVKHLAVANPMNPDMAMMRMSLLPAALSKVRENARYTSSMRFFELGAVSFVGSKGKPEEGEVLTMTVVPEKGTVKPFFVLKGAIEKLFSQFHIVDVEWRPIGSNDEMLSLFHPTRSALIVVGGTVVGSLGEFSPTALSTYNVTVPVAAAQLSFEALVPFLETAPVFVPLPKYPWARRDISLTVPSSVVVASISEVIRGAGGALLRSMELFDIYERSEEKSFAFHLSFGADDRTLTSAEMDGVFDEIVVAARTIGARLSVNPTTVIG